MKMGSRVLFGFDVEGAKFCEEYVRNKFEMLEGKVELLEIPVYKFLTPAGEIKKDVLTWFEDLASSFRFKFTAHADDNLPFIFTYPPESRERKLVENNLRVAEEIYAMKIVFHHKVNDDGIAILNPEEYDIMITLENNPTSSPFKVEGIARNHGLGFTLDIPHMCLYAVNAGKEHEMYEWVEHLRPDHLHISNTYFRHGSVLDSLLFLLKGDVSSAFVKLVGDFHLPLSAGHINYRKIFEKLEIPDTIVMEISTVNYELLMRSLGRKSRVEKGYEDDIKHLKKLLKIRGIY